MLVSFSTFHFEFSTKTKQEKEKKRKKTKALHLPRGLVTSGERSLDCSVPDEPSEESFSSYRPNNGNTIYRPENQGISKMETQFAELKNKDGISKMETQYADLKIKEFSKKTQFADLKTEKSPK